MEDIIPGFGVIVDAQRSRIMTKPDLTRGLVRKIGLNAEPRRMRREQGETQAFKSDLQQIAAAGRMPL